MAYTPKTWVCGETITADALNHLENGLADCCGGDCGYSCTETKTPITEESVTTSNQDEMNMGIFSYSQLIDADSLIVTFNGTEYIVEKTESQDGFIYGDFSPTGPDFSEYPFMIGSSASNGNVLFTETAGTYLVTLEAQLLTAETSECFEKAVGVAVKDADLVVRVIEEANRIRLDKTWQQVYDAYPRAYILEEGQGQGGESYAKYSIGAVAFSNNLYLVMGAESSDIYTASSHDDYPSKGK